MAFLFQATQNSAQIDNHAFVRTAPNFFNFVPSRNAKFDVFLLHVHNLCFGANAVADRGCCDMAYIDPGPEHSFP